MGEKLTYEALTQALQAQQYSPCYFLQGAETYYIDQLVKQFEKTVLPPALHAFNLIIRYGKEESVNTIVQQAKSFPLFGGPQLIIVKEAQEVHDLAKKQGQQLLIDYLNQPNPSTILVWAYKHKTVDSRSQLAKALVAKATLFTSQKLYEHQLPQWIENQVKQHGCTITPEATILLQAMVGNNLALLAKEIEKLAQHLAAPAKIQASLVTQFVGETKEYTLFQLQDALIVKDLATLGRITSYLSQHTAHYPLPKIIAYLTTFFSHLLQLRGKANDLTSARLAGLHPYLRKKYEKALPFYSVGQILQNIGHLHQADCQVKGVYYPSLSMESILKELIAKLVA